MVALSFLSETAAPSSESQKCVLYPSGRLDFTNLSPERGWGSWECPSPPSSPGGFSTRNGFPFQHCPAPASLVGCCWGDSYHLLPSASLQPEEEGVGMGARVSPPPGSVCLALGYRGVWATSPGASAESRHRFKAEVGAELLTYMAGPAPAMFLGTMGHPCHQLWHHSLVTQLQQLLLRSS